MMWVTRELRSDGPRGHKDATNQGMYTAARRWALLQSWVTKKAGKQLMRHCEIHPECF